MFRRNYSLKSWFLYVVSKVFSIGTAEEKIMEPHGLLRPLSTVVSLGLRERNEREGEEWERERGQGRSPRTYTHNDTAHNVVLWCGGDGRSRAVFSISLFACS